MLSAYLDESGTHDGSQPLCVAGVFFDAESRKRLNRRWKKELDRAGISYFHTVEQAHLRGQFAGKTREEVDRLYRALIPFENVRAGQRHDLQHSQVF